MRTADPKVFPLTLYYDSACPLCRAEMQNLMLRNTQDLLRFIDVSSPQFTACPAGTQKADLLRIMHAVQADGTLIQGVDVFRQAYRAAQLDWVAQVLSWPLINRCADRLYPWIARHRYRFPKFLVHGLFETAIRRAARRAAQRAHCDDAGTCQR